jgi:hypothetical protein
VGGCQFAELENCPSAWLWLGNIVTQCFAALWLHKCINYIYDAGVQDDTLPLWFIEIKNTELHLNLRRVFLICMGEPVLCSEGILGLTCQIHYIHELPHRIMLITKMQLPLKMHLKMRLPLKMRLRHKMRLINKIWLPLKMRLHHPISLINKMRLPLKMSQHHKMRLPLKMR